jgi:hypothetical protein
MSLEARSILSDLAVSENLRKAAYLIYQANALLQRTFEANEDLYAVCSTLESMSAELEMEADELDSHSK